MDRLSEAEMAERKKILGEIALVYNSRCMSGFEEWAENYTGPYKKFVTSVLRDITSRNSGSRRVYGIDDALIKELLNVA